MAAPESKDTKAGEQSAKKVEDAFKSAGTTEAAADAFHKEFNSFVQSNNLTGHQLSAAEQGQINSYVSGVAKGLEAVGGKDNPLLNNITLDFLHGAKVQGTDGNITEASLQAAARKGQTPDDLYANMQLGRVQDWFHNQQTPADLISGTKHQSISESVLDDRFKKIALSDRQQSDKLASYDAVAGSDIYKFLSAPSGADKKGPTPLDQMQTYAQQKANEYYEINKGNAYAYMPGMPSPSGQVDKSTIDSWLREHPAVAGQADPVREMWQRISTAWDSPDGHTSPSSDYNVLQALRGSQETPYNYNDYTFPSWHGVHDGVGGAAYTDGGALSPASVAASVAPTSGQEVQQPIAAPLAAAPADQAAVVIRDVPQPAQTGDAPKPMTKDDAAEAFNRINALPPEYAKLLTTKIDGHDVTQLNPDTIKKLLDANDAAKGPNDPKLSKSEQDYLTALGEQMKAGKIAPITDVQAAQLAGLTVDAHPDTLTQAAADAQTQRTEDAKKVIALFTGDPANPTEKPAITLPVSKKDVETLAQTDDRYKQLLQRFDEISHDGDKIDARDVKAFASGYNQPFDPPREASQPAPPKPEPGLTKDQAVDEFNHYWTMPQKYQEVLAAGEGNDKPAMFDKAAIDRVLDANAKAKPEEAHLSVADVAWLKKQEEAMAAGTLKPASMDDMAKTRIPGPDSKLSEAGNQAVADLKKKATEVAALFQGDVPIKTPVTRADAESLAKADENPQYKKLMEHFDEISTDGKSITEQDVASYRASHGLDQPGREKEPPAAPAPAQPQEPYKGPLPKPLTDQMDQGFQPIDKLDSPLPVPPGGSMFDTAVAASREAGVQMTPEKQREALVDGWARPGSFHDYFMKKLGPNAEKFYQDCMKKYIADGSIKHLPKLLNSWPGVKGNCFATGAEATADMRRQVAADIASKQPVQAPADLKVDPKSMQAIQGAFAKFNATPGAKPEEFAKVLGTTENMKSLNITAAQVPAIMQALQGQVKIKSDAIDYADWYSKHHGATTDQPQAPAPQKAPGTGEPDHYNQFGGDRPPAQVEPAATAPQVHPQDSLIGLSTPDGALSDADKQLVAAKLAAVDADIYPKPPQGLTDKVTINGQDGLLDEAKKALTARAKYTGETVDDQHVMAEADRILRLNQLNPNDLANKQIQIYDAKYLGDMHRKLTETLVPSLTEELVYKQHLDPAVAAKVEKAVTASLADEKFDLEKALKDAGVTGDIKQFINGLNGMIDGMGKVDAAGIAEADKYNHQKHLQTEVEARAAAVGRMVEVAPSLPAQDLTMSKEDVVTRAGAINTQLQPLLAKLRDNAQQKTQADYDSYQKLNTELQWLMMANGMFSKISDGGKISIDKLKAYLADLQAQVQAQ